MPLYEYKCDGCGKTFEVIQKFSDEPLTVHPECGGAVRRLLSSPALQFKGTGWYITDYAKSGSGKGGAKANGGSESKTESASPSTESKPAATNTSGSGSSTSGSSSSSSGSSSTGSK